MNARTAKIRAGYVKTTATSHGTAVAAARTLAAVVPVLPVRSAVVDAVASLTRTILPWTGAVTQIARSNHDRQRTGHHRFVADIRIRRATISIGINETRRENHRRITTDADGCLE